MDLFDPAVVGTDRHLELADALRRTGDVVEVPSRGRRTFAVVGHAALGDAARSAS